MNAKRQALSDFVDESDCRALVARVVDLQHANPRAIVDGGELIQSLARAGNALEELDVQLEPMAWPWFLIPLPTLAMRPMLLVRGEPVHPVTFENAVHG